MAIPRPDSSLPLSSRKIGSTAEPSETATSRDAGSASRCSGAAWRRAEARALHQEGISMDRIAQLFGVTRQRVSALLNSQPRSDSPPAPTAGAPQD